MIIVQTPLRVSFFGGGTDFAPFFRQEGGCVLSTAIDKYIFVVIKQRFDSSLRIGYTKTEMVNDLADIEHELIREALRMSGISSGVEVNTMGDIPSAGSGLGSSSTVTVGALHAMASYRRALISAEELARMACQIEIDILGKPIGVQDQYIAAYGGLRFMEFATSGKVLQTELSLSEECLRYLNESTMLFYTGVTRRSSGVLQEQQQNIKERLPILREMKAIAYRARDELLAGNLDAIGRLLDESWQLKKGLASRISTGPLDEMYAAACRAGATGGKIAGAGGGGFLLLFCPHARQNAVRSALRGLRELPFSVNADGSKVIFDYRR